jgi:hypothetical protein
MDNNLIDANFWNDFVEHHWEKKAFSLERALTKMPISADQLFKCIAFCVTDFPRNVGVRLYVETTLQSLYAGHPLHPKMSDNSFEGYNARMKKELDGKDYCLVITNLESVNFDLWDWSREFLFGLYEKIGFNSLGNYYGVFIGSYSKTPFGVHRDPESIFHFPIVGRKTLRVWAGGYETENPGINRAHDYSKFLDGSIKVEAGPGGMIYWSSPDWHIGERSDDFSVSLALSLNCYDFSIAQPLAQRAEVDLSGLVGEYKGIHVKYDPHNVNANASEMPWDFKTASNYMKNVDWDVVFQKQWIKLTTAFNFINPPQRAEQKAIRESDTLMGNKKYPVVSLKLEKGPLAISANGHLIELPYNEELVTVVEQLNNGAPISVTTLIQRIQPDQKQSILQLLSWLQSVRAVKVVVN